MKIELFDGTYLRMLQRKYNNVHAGVEDFLLIISCKLKANMINWP